MERRGFLGGAAGVAAAGLLAGTVGAQNAEQPAAQAGSREFYLLRRYGITRAQAAGCDRFLESAMLPALARLGYRRFRVRARGSNLPHRARGIAFFSARG